MASKEQLEKKKDELIAELSKAVNANKDTDSKREKLRTLVKELRQVEDDLRKL